MMKEIAAAATPINTISMAIMIFAMMLVIA
jgi:hypothetical protein